MLPFIRSDLAQLTAYTPHPGGDSGKPVEVSIDRLDTNESPYDLPVALKEKLAWTYQQLIETNRYPDGGHAALKEAIAQYVNEAPRLNNAITAANISVGNGSDELIRSLLIATCLSGCGSILVANPTFSMYGILAQTLGIPVVSVERGANFEIDLAAAQLAIASTQNPPIRVVFVVHPNSPTANALTSSELEWLRTLPEHILVVIDEAYFEFSQTTVVSELSQKPNWIVLRTFSKAFRLAAHRVGYAIANPELIAALEKIRLPYNLPTFSQAAAMLALQQRQLLLSSIPQTLAERADLINALTQHPELQVYESAANFIYLRLQLDYQKSDRLTKLNQQLRASGTLVRLINGGLRITVGSNAENLRTLNRLQAALAQENDK
ncbi:MAG: histidinol-phosphate transaminase [Gloeocapsa sp. UFS-A4-WI-NPMV-4B04]|jgi:histidinol-phosphate aminotransferase|nr:histidinol-phosphate transaminase [Gloeocapsa sp. UFS-A4-WI-NPMV-4B04]